MKKQRPTRPQSPEEAKKKSRAKFDAREHNPEYNREKLYSKESGENRSLFSFADEEDNGDELK